MGYRVVCTICEAEAAARGAPMPDIGHSGANPAPFQFAPAEHWQAVLAGGAARVNGMADRGTPAVVTYAFAPDRGHPERAPADAALIEGMREAVRHIESVAGLRFIEVDPGADPMLDLQYTTDESGWSWAQFPFVSATSANTTSQVLMNDVMSDFSPGTWGFEILLHELGHALGLKHPHDGRDRLDASMDDTSRTLMSYNRLDPHDAFQELDIAALRYLYGEADGLDGVTTVFNDAADLFMAKGTRGGDTLIGVNGVSILKGQGGADVLIGREANDRLKGGAGHDDISGSGGHDILMGGRGHDRMDGGAGDDRLIGQGGRDLMDGGTSDDLIQGGGGRDRLFGGTGSDTLAGGRGTDIMVGGPGADVFVAARRGRDIVKDFDPKEGDRIDISGLDLSASEAADRLTSMRGNLVFDTGLGTLNLEGTGDMSLGEWVFIG